MKKVFLTLAVFVMAICANAQTNQYFWYQGNLMMGNPIAQIDSVTFGEGEPADTLHILLPRTIIKTVHDTVYITIHDTVCPNNIPEGALVGEFSVSTTKKIRFSKGNLQFNAAQGTHQCADGSTQQGTWQFAENQWDYIGLNNKNASASYAGWIDIFGWGTSGYNNTQNDEYAINYMPWSTNYSAVNSTYNYYGYGPSINMQDTNLVGNSANYDWGMYNEINTAGNRVGEWRTLTNKEWNYLIKERENANNLCGKATVNSVNGFVILPDNWYSISDIEFSCATNNWGTNTYSGAYWENMEQQGAIFLPAAGYNYRGTYYYGNLHGGYWSSTAKGNGEALRLCFISGGLSPNDPDYRYYGFSVRLVQDVE